MFTSRNTLTKSNFYKIDVLYINLLLSPCYATPAPSEVAEPHWVSAYSDHIPVHLCVVELAHKDYIPCSIRLTDGDQKTRNLGPGLLLEDANNASRITCQQIVGATRSFSHDHSIKSLRGSVQKISRVVDGQKAGIRLKYLNDNNEAVTSQYRLFYISHSQFMVLECPENYRVYLDPQKMIQLFYDDPNPELIPTGSRGTSETSDNLEALGNSLNDAERFFQHMDSPSNSNDTEFCDNLCPSGFRATESLGQNGTGICNQKNRAIEPFFNDSNFDYTYTCTPCNNSYRYAFPLEKLTGYPGYEFECDYPCRSFRNCETPFVSGIEGSAIHDTVCDCPDDNIRLVVNPPHRIENRVISENNTLSLTDIPPTEFHARYYQYENSSGSLENYDFLCVTRSFFCEAYNQSDQLQLGYRFPFDNSSKNCFIPSVSNSSYSAYSDAVKNSIPSLRYRLININSHRPDVDGSTKEAPASPSIFPDTTTSSFIFPDTTISSSSSSSSSSSPTSGISSVRITSCFPGQSLSSGYSGATPTPALPKFAVSNNLPLIIGGAAIVAGSLITGVLVAVLISVKLHQHRRVMTGTGAVANSLVTVNNPIYQETINPYASFTPSNVYDSIGPESELAEAFMQQRNQIMNTCLGETNSVISDDTYTPMCSQNSIQLYDNIQ